MLENSYYSVISPEGAAAILWKNGAHRATAAEALKLGAAELEQFGLIDEVIPEPAGGAQHDHVAMANSLRDAVAPKLRKLIGLPTDKLLDARYRKFRAFGRFAQTGA